ncbi:hypothetical protein GCM10010349_63700 [Streptomyces flavofungini]|nr:hypothetical protein GCM10010349_63700 [Streptomyces flavofungini]
MIWVSGRKGSGRGPRRPGRSDQGAGAGRFRGSGQYADTDADAGQCRSSASSDSTIRDHDSWESGAL